MTVSFLINQLFFEDLCAPYIDILNELLHVKMVGRKCVKQCKRPTKLFKHPIRIDDKLVLIDKHLLNPSHWKDMPNNIDRDADED